MPGDVRAQTDGGSADQTSPEPHSPRPETGTSPDPAVAPDAGLPPVQRHILQYLRQCGATYWQAVPSQAIAAALNLFPSYVREQAHQLVTKGLLGVRQGRAGGYYLLVPQADRLPGAPPSEPILGLPDLRRFVRHHVGLWRRYGLAVAFIRLKLDQWPQWVRAVGPAVARTLVVEAATRLRSVLRSVDVVGQDGDDALVMVLPNTDRSGALQAAARLERALQGEPPLMLAHRLGIRLQASWQVATPPDDGRDADAVWRCLHGERPASGDADRTGQGDPQAGAGAVDS